MSFHGGFLGVLFALFLYTRHIKKDYWSTIDFIAPLVPFGLGAGRIGNFIGGELWGRPTDVAWGMVFPMSINYPGTHRNCMRLLWKVSPCLFWFGFFPLNHGPVLRFRACLPSVTAVSDFSSNFS